MKEDTQQPAGNLGGFTLLRGKLKPGQCSECACFHEPQMPHDQTSLFWQYSFREKTGRWPTWSDALAHCTTEMRAMWVEGLAEEGITVDAPQMTPPSNPAPSTQPRLQGIHCSTASARLLLQT